MGDKIKTGLASIRMNRLAVFKTVKDSPCRLVHHRLKHGLSVHPYRSLSSFIIVLISACTEYNILNSVIDMDSPPVPGTVATVTCHDGRTLPNGLTSQQFVCQSDGQWYQGLSVLSCECEF